jgi:hypothetical protein
VLIEKLVILDSWIEQVELYATLLTTRTNTLTLLQTHNSGDSDMV